MVELCAFGEGVLTSFGTRYLWTLQLFQTDMPLKQFSVFCSCDDYGMTCRNM